MNKIVIGGISGSDEFAVGFALVHLANKKCPSLCTYEFHDKAKNDYWRWVRFLNESNGWKHKDDFIGWFEYVHGGPKSLIGGLELFTEYMYNEFGVSSRMTQSKIRDVAEALRQAKKIKLLNEAKFVAQRRTRNVSVVYEGHPGVGLFCREIMSNQHLVEKGGLQLTLFNLFPFVAKSTARLHDDLAALSCHSPGVRTVRIVNSFKRAVRNCDLLIFMGDDTKKNDSLNLLDDLKLMAAKWTKLGLIVNKYVDNPEMRVILTCMTYPCFNATFFIHAAPQIPSDLVVAVTHHLGFYPLAYLSRASGIPLSHIMHRTAHVWGSPNISHVVDTENTDFIFNRTVIPAEKVKEIEELANEINWTDGTNPFDNAEFEEDLTWRKMDYVVKQLDKIWTYVSKEKERITEWQQREPYVATIRATMEIISHWYSKTLPQMPISVGINTSGAHGFPKGLVVSVPALVRDNDHRGWYDFKWCEGCRRSWDMDLRPRWEPSLCPHKTLHKLTSVDFCCHQRNPDIFLPSDNLLSVEEMAYSISAVFASLDPTRRLLNKLLATDKTAQRTELTKDEAVQNINPAVDDFAARIRKKKYKIMKKSQKATFGRVLALKKKYATLTATANTVETSRKRSSRKNRILSLVAALTGRQDHEAKTTAPALLDKLLDVVDGRYADTIPIIHHYVKKIFNEKHKKTQKNLNAAIDKLNQMVEKSKKNKQMDDGKQLNEAESETQILDRVRRKSEASLKSGDDLDNQVSSKNFTNQRKASKNTRVNEEEDEDTKELGYESSDLVMEQEGEHEELQRPESEWDLDLEVKNDVFLTKLLDAITDDDIPLVKRYKEQLKSQYIPKDISKPSEWMKDPQIFQRAEDFFSDQSVENPGRTYLKEYMSEKLAKIDWFCNEYIPKNVSHMYCMHTKKEHKKLAEDNEKKLFSFLPEIPPKIIKMELDKFVPPDRELGQSDVLYETRWAEAREIFEKRIYSNYLNKTGEEVYYGNSLAKVVALEQEEEEGEEEEKQEHDREGIRCKSEAVEME